MHQAIQARQVVAEQAVEAGHRGRRIVVAEPPEPVGALAHGKLGLRRGGRGLVQAPAGGDQVIALLRRAQQLPGAVLVRVPYPGGQVAIDPASRHQRRQGARVFPVLRQAFAEGGAAYALVAGQQRIHVVEEIVGVVGIVFPGVLAIEDHRHDGGLPRRRRFPDLVQLGHEMPGGIAAVPFAVFEADQVRQALVAEEQGEAGRLGQAPGAVQVFVARRRVGAVALQAVRQHGLAGGGPLDALGRDQLQKRRGHGAFGRPQARRRRPEAQAVAVDGGAQLGGGTHAPARIDAAQGQGYVRHGLARTGEIDQQRPDRVGVGRGGQLDLAALGQRPVTRYQVAQGVADIAEQAAPVVNSEALALAHQFRQQGRAPPFRLAGPRQVIPGDQVGEVASRQIADAKARLVAAQAAQLEQALVARVGSEYARMVAAETGLEQPMALLQGEVVMAFPHQHAQQGIAQGVAVELGDVVLDLVQQHGNEIHHGADRRVALQVGGHVRVVLEAVQIDPGQQELAAVVIAVIRLVHMPEEDQVQLLLAHATCRQSGRDGGGTPVPIWSWRTGDGSVYTRGGAAASVPGARAVPAYRG